MPAGVRRGARRQQKGVVQLENGTREVHPSARRIRSHVPHVTLAGRNTRPASTLAASSEAPSPQIWRSSVNEIRAVINFKTANSLRLVVPNSMLLLADEVIERGCSSLRCMGPLVVLSVSGGSPTVPRQRCGPMFAHARELSTQQSLTQSRPRRAHLFASQRFRCTQLTTGYVAFAFHRR
jgi:hypothetical protein